MSNEKILEEILFKSYEMGINEKVLSLASELLTTHDFYAAYFKAFEQITSGVAF